jgi:hypothetical protein
MSRRLWTAAELQYVRRHYADTLTETIAHAIDRSPRAVFQRARELGLRKSHAFLSSEASGRWRAGEHNGAQTCFRKGHVPHNKGVKGWQAGGRSTQTQFKRGHWSARWDPEAYVVGALRINSDGELDIKVLPRGARAWIPLARYVWAMEHDGRLPPRGFKVAHRNGDQHDCRPENLELVSDAELMRRNTIHARYPRELKRLIQQVGQVKRRIREHEVRRSFQ